MVLQDFDAPHYLRRERVFINTDTKDPVRSRSDYDMVFDLDDFYEKVQSVELVSWTIPFDMSPTIYRAFGTNPANNLLDIRLSDPPGNANVLEFTTELISFGYGTLEEFGQSVVDQITFRLLTLGDPYYNPDTNDFVMSYSITGGKLSFSAIVDDPPVVVDVRFLFGTGTNAGSTPATALGMVDGVDTPITTVNGYDIHGPIGVVPAILSPFRYTDVKVSGVDYNVARVPLTGPDFVTKRFNKTKFRLVDTPIRNVQETRITLTLPNGIEPIKVSTNGYDMVLEYLVLSPETGVPKWMVQSFGM